LPETQRGLVISEIAQFRERAAKREREKMRDVRESIPLLVPSGPKREWGKSQSQQATPPSKTQATGKGSQGYSKPVGFVKAESDDPGRSTEFMKTDEELEAERKEARRRDEENSFRDVSIDLQNHHCL
jgi:RNA-binding protein 25